jgi:PKD repeat protein
MLLDMEVPPVSEEKKESKGSGWLKAILGTAAGLLSGALVMYISPLVDKVIKPAKPVANFAIEHQGLTVSFLNRSTGGGKARWDFGDGSPLEFVPANQPIVSHTYKKTGTYVAKLVVTNLIGEENERTVTVETMETAEKPKVMEKPAIVDLYVRPPGKVGEPVYAPATFQFKATADNAMHYVWDFGDGKGILMADDMMSHTFDKPGVYTIKLCAFNGKERSEEETIIEVGAPPTGMLKVSLQVADEGYQIETRRREVPVSQAFELKGKKAPDTVEQLVSATPGYEIVSFERKKSNNDNLEKTDWKLAADKRSLKAVCQVKKVAANTTAFLNEQLVLVEQRKVKASRDPIPVAGTLSAPGTATLRLPPTPDDWTDVQRQVVVQLVQDDKVIWKGATLPKDVQVNVGGRPYLLGASLAGERLTVQLATRIAGN